MTHANTPSPAMQEAALTDDQIEALAKKHIAPHADRLDAIMQNPVPYQQTEQFRRVKAMIVDVLSKLRAPVADAQPVAYLHKSNLTLTWPGKLTEVQLNSGVWRPLYEHPPVASTPVAGWMLRGPAGGSWREEFSRRVYDNLIAADYQYVPLEEYPARILAVLDDMGAPVAGEAVAEVQIDPHSPPDDERVIIVPLVDFEAVDAGTKLYAAPQASEASAYEAVGEVGFNHEGEKVGGFYGEAPPIETVLYVARIRSLKSATAAQPGAQEEQATPSWLNGGADAVAMAREDGLLPVPTTQQTREQGDAKP